MSVDPKNLTAQLQYRGAGNPPSSHPDQAISNCYPGLEFDFRNAWRRILEGIELHEADNYVVAAQPPNEGLVGHRLLLVAGAPIVTEVVGPRWQGQPSGLLRTASNPDGVVAMEWSNVLAGVLRDHAGETVTCHFSSQPTALPVGIPVDRSTLLAVELRVRELFARSDAARAPIPVVEESLVQPGELTQSLCSPWQNDYRECACYYWAASRPDYVNVELTEDGDSTGNMWFAKDREPRQYILDDRKDTRLVTYDELFADWQGLLRFIVGGKDHE